MDKYRPKLPFIRSSFICVLLFSGLIISGCSKTESEHVKSSGLSAVIEVSGAGNGTTEVQVELRVGNRLTGTLVELTGGDRLLAHANGETKQLRKDENLFDIKYETTFDFNDEGTQFRIELDRPSAVSAPNSTAILPLAANITLPLAGETVARNAPLTVAWEPAFTPDHIRIRFQTECTGSTGGIYRKEVNKGSNDNGSYTINTSELNTLDPALNPNFNTCELTITVYRERDGSLDPGYGDGGVIHGIQRRSITVPLEFL